MIPTQGVLKVLGTAAGAAPVTVPADATHFVFRHTTLTNTHVTVLLGGSLVAFAVGVPIGLHDPINKPTISNGGGGAASFTNVDFYKIVSAHHPY